MYTRTVYRYENFWGVGPYSPSEWDDYSEGYELLFEHNDKPAFRGDEEQPADFVRTVAGSHLSGCASREALDAWFEGWHDRLAANGFRVVEYNVPACQVVDSISGLQVAFIPM